MSLPLRITFEGKDYTYTILTRFINKNTSEIKIRMEDEELTLFRNQKNEWDALERKISHEQDLIRAIAKNIALRYGL